MGRFHASFHLRKNERKSDGDDDIRTKNDWLKTRNRSTRKLSRRGSNHFEKNRHRRRKFLVSAAARDFSVRLTKFQIL